MIEGFETRDNTDVPVIDSLVIVARMYIKNLKKLVDQYEQTTKFFCD